ncbi:flavin-containing monooxygenase [Mycobacterium parmense]|uniref:Pyridine nucleotide-disulfide oxidoreductase n=1 Tax=Mycobacterium parmense TaxID=185642 RepID=A0A7I7YQ19_9MYCO|nr:NAD(P)/FAD-dependent oxidoreductase [Mycobacterium parmense]MCV7349613.1 NAD(P)/FAD-dependent oxidoreductase [Mycobacterium parmense]ORW58896.1 monooxygenase [Mycobacterium parmense]BBZ43749.1 pyridine nucleotide-disulfide oxidoreductase [Mycobacterium parmense]
MDTEFFEAVVVGAGFGGIGAAIQLKRLGYENFVILDRESDLGGTWHVNRYPGVACDVPATTYSYWFEPNPRWSRLFAPGAELKRYAEQVADKYDVRRHMRFNQTVEGARWDEDAHLWQVALVDGRRLQTSILVTATGFLSQPRVPNLPGIESFGGKVFHTAAWDEGCRFAGRRVGVIGTGASAVQLVPELARQAAELTVYQRTAIHTVPKIDFPFPAAIQQLFSRLPLSQRLFRWVTDTFFELITLSALRYRQFRRLGVDGGDVAAVSRFVTVRDAEVRRKLTPDYDFGCKRPTWSNHYYPAFDKPHVHLRTDPIERIDPDGVVTANGEKDVVDVLVLATGFDLWDANFPVVEVIGRQGRNLGKWWRENRFQAYQGITIPWFPNYLNLVSPYGFSGLSFFNTIEYQMRHMDRLLGEYKRRGATTFEVTEQANARFLDRMTRSLGDSVFRWGDCATSRSYYFNPSGEAALLRPTSTRNAVREASTFPLDDYTIA